MQALTGHGVPLYPASSKLLTTLNGARCKPQGEGVFEAGAAEPQAPTKVLASWVVGGPAALAFSSSLKLHARADSFRKQTSSK